MSTEKHEQDLAAMQNLSRPAPKVSITSGHISVKFTPDEELIAKYDQARKNPDTTTEYTYVCEVCDRTERLTEAVAYESGWDYPPFIGMWGVVSPRTCPNCTIEKTAYWQVITQGTLTEKHLATIDRINKETRP